MARIADILKKAQKHHFTGREKEMAEFRQLLNEPQLTAHILFIYGPAGQGKTTVLKEFTELCRLNQNPFIHIDGREVVPSVAGFNEALFTALNVDSIQKVFEVIEQSNKTFVLFIDTYKKINALDSWLRQEFLPQLPGNMLTVIAERNQPSPEWFSDSGWQDLIKKIQLRNFTPDESQSYLEKRNVPATQYNKILDFTHGHPLALSLVADLLLQNPDKDFSPNNSPDIVQTLINNFSLKTPTPAHKTALEICALTYVTTESLLASVMGVEDASELFEWVKNLSFIENNKWGLFPHDLARESLIADLKWRNPDWFSHLYNKIADYYIHKLEHSSGDELRNFLFHLTYLQRNNPMVRPFYNWEESQEIWVDLMKPDDVKPLTTMVEEFYGAESVKSFKFWLNNPAAQVWVWRSPINRQCAFFMRININEIDEKEKVKDEIIQNVIDLVDRDFNLRKGEIVTVFRFWMAAKTHQNISKLQSSIFLFITQYYLTTKGLAIHFLAVENPEFWKNLLSYYGMEYVPSLDYTVNNVLGGFYMHDWRKTPPKQWLNSLGRKKQTNITETKPGLAKKEMVILSETAFYDSVYQALKDYHSDKKLENNPLIQSRFVMHAVAEENAFNTNELIAILKEKMDAALKKIEESPRYDALHHLLYRTFINPVGSQEQTAEFLKLPFSTYRRHLKKAVTLIFDMLWKQETSS